MLVSFMKKEIAAHFNTIAISHHSVKCPPGIPNFSPAIVNRASK